MQRRKKEDEGQFFELFDAIKKAEAECEHEKDGEFRQFCHAIKKAEAMPKDWKAAATYLERCHPERWSKDRLELDRLSRRLTELEKRLKARTGS